MSKFTIVTALYTVLCIISVGLVATGNLALSAILFLLAQILLISLLWAIHKFLVFDSARTRGAFKDESRVNRKLIKELRNSEKRSTSRLGKEINALQAQLGQVEQKLQGELSLFGDKISEAGLQPSGVTQPVRNMELADVKWTGQPQYFDRLTSLSEGTKFAAKRMGGRLYSAFRSAIGLTMEPKSATDLATTLPSNADQIDAENVKETVSDPVSSIKPERRMAQALSGAFSKTGETVAQQTEDRLVDPLQPRVLFVSSNGAGLGHLTRLSAVDKHLDALSLFYTMSSAYKMIGKSSPEAIYFPSHGDLGMVGKLWNPLMEEHFDAVVDGFRPDAIVFDGTYVYRGVISVSKKRKIPLIWMQRGCWKAEVDARSKQRHNANKFASMVLVPGDYGCEESVDVGNGMEPIYLPPITLAGREDLLSKEEARNLLGLPKDKKLFLVQLGAGNINDITDTRETALDAVRSLGSDWTPVLVRNPLSKNAQESEALSIQAYPLSIYYNAFEAGAFAAGYNTVQEAIEMGLPAVFVPNLQTKTDDQGRRASEIEAQGLGFSARDNLELTNAIRSLGDPAVREKLKNRQDDLRSPSGGLDAARTIARFIDQ